MWRREAEREYEAACFAYLFLVLHKGYVGRYAKLEAAGQRVMEARRELEKATKASGHERLVIPVQSPEVVEVERVVYVGQPQTIEWAELQDPTTFNRQQSKEQPPCKT